ncbi:NADP-dependent isocitrate dehydrogenase, partial [Microbacterium sp. T32]|uniref:NADP-dependent isocitrate dehydrogenase n=1 Tax=Microbacterium sp. T32 TaxID=1776083 RepID=UPI0018D27C65
RVEIVDGDGNVVIEHDVQPGDIWRATQTKYVAIVDWVNLAVRRARATNVPAVFWLDVNRAHDAQIIAKVYQALATIDTQGLELLILPPAEATRYTLAR